MKKLSDLKTGARIRGLAPFGIRWFATKTKTGFKPDGNCPTCEFLPCEYWDATEWKNLTPEN
jgi:hypothetical protein